MPPKSILVVIRTWSIISGNGSSTIGSELNLIKYFINNVVFPYIVHDQNTQVIVTIIVYQFYFSFHRRRKRGSSRSEFSKS